MSELSEFDQLMEGRLKDLKRVVEEGTISGYVDGEQNYIDLMNELSSLGYSYSTRGSDYYKLDGKNIWFSKNSGKNRSPYIHAFGSPFSLVKTTYLHCALGSKYYSRSKENIYEINDPNPKRTRTLRSARPTKKMDCPAWMTIKCVKVYPEFVTDKVIRRTKEKLTSVLKNALKLLPPPRSFLRYYFKATVGQSHSHSTACMQLSQEIHPDLIKEIQRVVEQGTTSVRDVKMLLEQYVDKLFADGSKPKPARINKAFYPNEKVIYTHIYRALNSAKKSQNDQEILTVENCEYIIIDGEVTEMPQVIEVTEMPQVNEEMHNVSATSEIEIFQIDEEASNVSASEQMVKVFQVDEGNHNASAADETVGNSDNVSSSDKRLEISQACKKNQHLAAADELEVIDIIQMHDKNGNVAGEENVEAFQVHEENCNVTDSDEMIEISEVYGGNHNVPATDDLTETTHQNCPKSMTSVIYNVPVKVKMVEIPQMNIKMHNVAEKDNSDTVRVEKAQQSIRDEAKKIMDLSYHCNDIESLTNIHFAISKQRIEMESKVGILPLLLLSANDYKKVRTTPFRIET